MMNTDTPAPAPMERRIEETEAVRVLPCSVAPSIVL
jgi:hypothetical protein